MQQEIRQLELLCKQLYESQDGAIRSEAEKALVVFQDSPDALTKCQVLLDRGDSAYAQLLAATTLTKLVSRSAQGIRKQFVFGTENTVVFRSEFTTESGHTKLCTELPGY